MPGLLEAQRQAREAARQAKKDEDEKQVKTDQRMRDAEAREQKKLAPYLRELDALAKQYQGNPEALKVIAARRERLKRGYSQVTGRDVPEVPYSGEEGSTYHPEELAHATAGLKLPGLSDADQAAAKAKEATEIEGRVQRYRNWVAAHPRHRMNVDAGEQWLRSGKTGPIQSPEFPDVHFDPLDQKNRAWGPSQDQLDRRRERQETKYRRESDAALAKRLWAKDDLDSEDPLTAGAARAYITELERKADLSKNLPLAARLAEEARQDYLRFRGPMTQAAAPVRPQQFTQQLRGVLEPPPRPRPQPGEFPELRLDLNPGARDYGVEAMLQRPGGLVSALYGLRKPGSAPASPMPTSPSPGSGPVSRPIPPGRGAPRQPEPMPVPPFAGQSPSLRPAAASPIPDAPAGSRAGGPALQPGGFQRTGRAPRLPSATLPGEAEIKRQVLAELNRVEQLQMRRLSEAERNAISRATRAKLGQGG